MGANQFENPKNQATFFNWFFFTLYAATVVSITAIVYVEDNVGWRLGFGLCAIADWSFSCVGPVSIVLINHKGAHLWVWLAWLLLQLGKGISSTRLAEARIITMGMVE